MLTVADSFSVYGSRFNTYRILSRRACLLLARTMIHGLKEVCVHYPFGCNPSCGGQAEKAPAWEECALGPKSTSPKVSERCG